MERIGWLFGFGLLGTLGFLALLIFGLMMLKEERAAKRAKETGQEATPAPKAVETKTPALKWPPQIGTLFSMRLNRTQTPEAHEVLRVLRDHLTGRLIVEISGRRYAQASEMNDPQIYQGFLTTLQDLSTFAAHAPAPTPMPTPPVNAPDSAVAPPVAPTTDSVPPSKPPLPPPQPAPISNLSTPRASPPRTSAPLPPPSMNPLRQMQVLREMSKQPPPPLKTIAEQIDEVLQARIAGTPHLQRGLRVNTGPQGNAVFELDGRVYETVDDLPEAEARALIRAAIAEWERRQ